MAVEVLVPKLGLTMTEGTINEWLVAAGDEIAVGQPIMTMATDKVDVEVEAEAAGIFHPAVPAGSALPPGALIAWLLEPGEVPPADAAEVARAGAAATHTAIPAAELQPVVAASTTEVTTTAAGATSADVAGAAPVSLTADGRLMASPNARRIAKDNGVDVTTIRGTGPGGRIVSEDVEALVAEIVAATAAPTAPADGNGPVDGPVDRQVNGQNSGHGATPLVRKLAGELGVDLADVSPTGPGGKVTRSDVLRAADKLGVVPAARTATPPAQQLTGLRGAIARNMMASLHETAQLTLGHEADVTALVATRAALKAENAASGRRTPTVSDFVVRAAALALREHPRMNSSLQDGRIVSGEHINVGVAVALDDGLVVPVLREADSGSLYDLSERTAALAGAARAGKLGLPQLEGATFAVSSLGTSGIDFFTPIINPGNAGILGVGRIRDGVKWEGERPVRTSVITLSLTFDHRLVDGAPAAAYLLSVSELLSRPLGLLAG